MKRSKKNTRSRSRSRSIQVNKAVDKAIKSMELLRTTYKIAVEKKLTKKAEEIRLYKLKRQRDILSIN